HRRYSLGLVHTTHRCIDEPEHNFLLHAKICGDLVGQKTRASYTEVDCIRELETGALTLEFRRLCLELIKMSSAAVKRKLTDDMGEPAVKKLKIRSDAEPSTDEGSSGPDPSDTDIDERSDLEDSAVTATDDEREPQENK